MKRFIAVILCKLIYFVGKTVGRGSSLPGQVALKICPDILGRIQLPDRIIAVSGSNGKTSTVEMIAHILQTQGKKVIWNKEGSNQIEGVTTFLLVNAGLTGKIKCDAVLLESDERYARLTFRWFHPTHFVLTNLYRDQMTRNAHPEWIYDILKDAVYPETRLILNANDPLLSKYGVGKSDVVYFSMDENEYSVKEPSGAYFDGYYCPVCGGRLQYDYIHFAHIGKYACESCGFRSNEPQCRVTHMDLINNTIIFDGKYPVTLSFSSSYNVYNLLAAYTLAVDIGLDRKAAAEALSGYLLKSGRVYSFCLGRHTGILLTSKHENSVSYNQSLTYVRRHNRDCQVMIIVDAISRKYYTCETGWLYDIDFDMLTAEHVKKVILTGQYCHDLALRFSFIPNIREKAEVFPSIDDAVAALNTDDTRDLFVITCFSDKQKFIDRLPGKSK